MTNATTSRTSALHEAFSTQVEKTPHALAVSDGEACWTYAEINSLGNRVAQALVAGGIQPGDRVGICAERSHMVVAAILGTLKAGACYLPLDPEYPSSRLEFLVDDAKPGAVLAEAGTAGVLPGSGDFTLLRLDEVLADARLPDSDPGVKVSSTELAYIIYTSGSTGRPKGVEVSHQNVLRLFSATADWFDFGPDDVWTLFHSFAFDFSVWEIWGALLFGGRLVMVPHLVSRSPRDFRDLLKREKVTVLNQTPSAFLQLMEADKGESDLLPLRFVIFGGEALKFGSLGPWVEKYGDDSPALINMYGITETTVHVTYRRVRTADVRSGGGSFIGVPIPDLEIFILDAEGSLSPQGTPGELYVGGGGVARGYLGRPELTAQRFMDNPFGSGRLYRTGDKVRATAEGDLEYLGRLDTQIQLRGFRVELGEVEDCVSRFPGILETAVILREDRPGDERLVAYYVPVAGQAVGAEALDEHIRGELPSYMVPSHLLSMDSLPLTAHGKIHREALPSPEEMKSTPSGDEGPSETEEASEPGNDLEELLVDVWREVLASEELGRNSDFFLKGGHSLLAIEAMGLVEGELGLKIPFKFIFQNSTPATLAAALDEWVEQKDRGE